MSDQDPEADAFPASENTPGQKESRAAYARFLENTGLARDAELRAANARDGIWSNMGGKPAWLTTYQELRNEGWDWRRATFIAWAACPTNKRWPENQQELAVLVLGLKSDRTIRHWCEKDPRIDERISRLLIETMMKRRQDAVEAMMAVASTHEASGFNDRKLMFEITGLYKPKQKTEVSGPEGGPIENRNTTSWSELNDDELDATIANLQAAAGTAR